MQRIRHEFGRNYLKEVDMKKVGYVCAETVGALRAIEVLLHNLVEGLEAVIEFEDDVEE